jgi:hypothetical protein
MNASTGVHLHIPHRQKCSAGDPHRCRTRERETSSGSSPAWGLHCLRHHHRETASTIPHECWAFKWYWKGHTFDETPVGAVPTPLSPPRRVCFLRYQSRVKIKDQNVTDLCWDQLGHRLRFRCRTSLFVAAPIAFLTCSTLILAISIVMQTC